MKQQTHARAPRRGVLEQLGRADAPITDLAEKFHITLSGASFLSCEADVRTGGTYRFVFSPPSAEQPMPFFGKYLEVTPDSRLVWTNDEGDEKGPVTTVTFEESRGETRVVIRELYPSKETLDDAMASGITSWSGEQFEQLDELLAARE